jgi:hypothetical protein
MKDDYTISEFHTLLKLNLFKSGKVWNWGYVSICDNPLYLKKPLTEYQNQSYAKKQLGIGLYLLDLYLLQNDLYVMIITVCRTDINHKEKIYALKLSSTLPVDAIKNAIQESVPYVSSFTRKKTTTHRRIDTSPINSYTRKY